MSSSRKTSVIGNLACIGEEDGRTGGDQRILI